MKKCMRLFVTMFISHTASIQNFISINITASFEETTEKQKKIDKLLNRGVALPRYIPCLKGFFYQGKI